MSEKTRRAAAPGRARAGEIMLLTFYPLSLRLSAAPGMTFAAWGLCAAAGALAAALAYRLFGSRGAGADEPD